VQNWNKKEDYKDYVYLRIPKDEYKKIIDGQKKITSQKLKEWRYDYELKQSSKTQSAKKAHKIKKARTIQKIYKALENYYLGLFQDEKKELTPYKLSKLAKVNFRTAKKFWEEHKLSEWVEKFKLNPQQYLKEFKIQEIGEYFI